jgi:predicted metal-dependent phosphoesterase TrpH
VETAATRLVKTELHSHTNEDPDDAIGHSARELVEAALSQGYGALAITLHDRYFDDSDTIAFAKERGLTLIPAIERTIEQRHILLVNYPRDCERVGSFDELRTLKARHPQGLVVAAHPFFPFGSSLGREMLERHADLWDAVEINAFHTSAVDFNRAARSWAVERRVPLVGNGDVHQMAQLGSCYSLVTVSGEVTADSVCDAIRRGHVRVESRPLSHAAALLIAARAALSAWTGRVW